MLHQKNNWPPLPALAALLLVVILTLPAQAQTWELVWSDEFDSAAVNTNKWEFQIGDGSAYGIPGWGNNELQYYRSENAAIENGKLVITAKRESFGGKSYTSTRMRTYLKGDWTYGRFEIRAKLPFGKGIWPAIWMLPTDNVYGGWAASGEIDIMELVGHEPNKIYGSLHYGGAWPNNTFVNASHTLPAGNFSDDFHTFRLEWKPGEIRWYMDDVLYHTRTQWWSSNGPFPAPFDKRFHLLLNVAVGGNWPGSPDATTTFPQRMEVDYVRVYRDRSVSVEEREGKFVPQAFALHQNFPNPFNPATILHYDLPQADAVTLEIYDLNGKKIATLVNKQQAAGQYALRFDGSALSSGVYVASLRTTRFQGEIKMLLMR
jgi:beta-glucanase (GH16 family)